MAQRYSARFMTQVVLEVLESQRNIPELSRAYNIHPNTLRNWVGTFKSNAAAVLTEDGETKAMQQQIRELEQLLGRKEREIALLRNSVHPINEYFVLCRL